MDSDSDSESYDFNPINLTTRIISEISTIFLVKRYLYLRLAILIWNLQIKCIWEVKCA